MAYTTLDLCPVPIVLCVFLSPVDYIHTVDTHLMYRNGERESAINTFQLYNVLHTICPPADRKFLRSFIRKGFVCDGI